MRRLLDMTKKALDFWEGLDPKQYRQVGCKLFSLLDQPVPHDSSDLKGYSLKRVDVGE